MNNKSTILTLIVVAIFAIGSSIIFTPTVNVEVSPTPVTVNVPEQKAPVVNVNPQVRAPDVKVTVPETKQTLGAVTGPDFSFPYFGVNGLNEWSYSKKLATGTSTVCSFKTPPATTTLEYAGIRFTLASTTAQILDLAKDTSPSATTTKIGTTYNIGASAQATIVASTTGSVAGDATLFAPNTYLNWKIGPTSGGGAGNASKGVCSAKFYEI